MKKFFVLLLCIMVLPLWCNITYGGAISNDEGVVVPIEKKGEEEEDKNNPRSIAFSPIICYYSNDIFALLFYQSFEDATIIIENITTGEQWSKFINYSESIVKIPVSSNNGTYHISIHTDEGVYSGAFHKEN